MIKGVKILKDHLVYESIMTMLASEDVLKKDWNNKLDERWDKLKIEEVKQR